MGGSGRKVFQACEPLFWSHCHNLIIRLASMLPAIDSIGRDLNGRFRPISTILKSLDLCCSFSPQARMSCTCPRWPRTRRWSSTSWTKEWRSTSGATETSSVRKIRSTQGTTRSTTKSWTCARNQTTRGKNKSWHLYHFSLSPDFGERKGKKKCSSVSLLMTLIGIE